jgi:hypothetical protein
MDDTPRSSSSRLHPVKVYGSGGGGGQSAAPRKKASPVLAGVLVGIPAAALWALIAYVTHYEIGWVAWGVGALIGFAVAKSAHEPSASLGATAAALAVVALILGKVLILEFALPPILRNEILKDRDATAAMFLVDMGLNRSFSPELQSALEQAGAREDAVSSEQRDELQGRMQAEALARAASATKAERERVVRVHSAGILSSLGFFTTLKELFSLWDVVWIGLAISSAFKIAQGASG